LRYHLRTGGLAHPATVAREGWRVRLAAVLALTAGVALCGVNGVTQRRLAQHWRAAEQAFRERATGIAGCDIGEAKGDQALRIIGEAVARREIALRPFTRAFEPSLTVALAAIVEIGERSGLQFETLTLGEQQFAARGSAGNWRACDELMAYLKHREIAAELDRKDAGADGRVPFEIRSEGRHDETGKSR
jgi:hypothetical protein